MPSRKLSGIQYRKRNAKTEREAWKSEGAWLLFLVQQKLATLLYFPSTFIAHEQCACSWAVCSLSQCFLAM